VTKEERIAYMADLCTIHQFHEDFGVPVNQVLQEEYQLHCNELFKILGEEHEARKRDEHAKRDEGRTEVDRGESGGGRTDGERDRPGAFKPTNVRGQGPGSSHGG
jgi:hypothetical protein